jgi:hypothetical protein
MCVLWFKSALAKKNSGGVEAYKELIEVFILQGITGNRKESAHG